MRQLFLVILLVLSLTADGYGAPAVVNPLVEAAKKGNLEQVKVLILKGAGPNQIDSEGKNALHWAAAEGHADVAAYLLDHKAAINAQDSKYKETPLVEAAQFGRLDVVKLLISRGAAIDIKGKYGGTALTSLVNNVGVASQKTSEAQVYEIISLLLAHGADPNAQNADGETMLHMPAYGNEVKLVSVLVKGKLKPDLKTKSGETALDYACRGKGDVEMFDVLRNAGFKPSHGYAGCLQGAVEQSKLRLVQKLLTLGPPPPNLLATAAAGNKSGDEQIALLLLEKTAAANSPSLMKITALHGAAMTNKTKLTAALLRKGAKVDVQASFFATGFPLHFAARFGNPDVVQLLLMAKAKVDDKNENGDTPLMLAVQGPIDYRPSDGPGPDWSKTPSYVKVIELLVANGANVNAKSSSGKSVVSMLSGVSNTDFKRQAAVALQRGRH